MIKYERVEAGPSWRRLFLDALVLKEAWKAVAEFKPDLVHAHLHEGCMIGMALKARFKLPLIFDYQGSLTSESIDHGFIKAGSVAARAFAGIEQRIDRGPDLTIVSNGALASALARRGRSVETLPDAVDPQRFQPGPPDPALLQKLGLAEDRPVAVYLGVLGEYQGTDVLVQAARLLLDSGRHVQFLVMGYPEQEFQARAERAGLGGCMTFFGRVDYFQAAQYLRLGTVALAPKLARTESNGKVLVYMACGLAVAAFDLPVNRELLGSAAQWVEPAEDRGECAARFARGIAELLDNKERSVELAAAGRRRVEQELSIQVQGQKLVAIYERILGAGR